MATRVTVHSTAKTAVVAVAVALLVGLAVLGLKRVLRPVGVDEVGPAQSDQSHSGFAVASNLLLPVAALDVPSEASDLEWGEALAELCFGHADVAKNYGTISVETDRFVINVDRLADWHEAIRQASHYSDAAGKRPAIAIIVLPGDRVEELDVIDETCRSSGITLLILQSKSSRNADVELAGD